MAPLGTRGLPRGSNLCHQRGVLGEAAEPWGPFICCHVLARRVRNWDVLHRGGGTHPSRPGAPLRWQGAGRVTGYFPVIGLFAFLCNRVVDTGIAYGDTAVGGVRLLSEPPLPLLQADPDLLLWGARVPNCPQHRQRAMSLDDTGWPPGAPILPATPVPAPWWHRRAGRELWARRVPCQ